MRKLGAELGVEAMSLYRHVANKEAVLDGVAELLVELLEIPSSSPQSWQKDVRRVARSYRRVALAHPRAFPLLALRPFATPRAAEWEGAVLDLFRRAGFDGEAARFAFRTFGSFTAGHLLEEVAAPSEGEARERWEAAYAFGINTLLVGLETVQVRLTKNI